MPPEKTVDSMAVEITHLQQGQVRIESSIDKLSDKLDGVGQALTSLIRLTEKHDALADRVKILETASAEREEIASAGKAYMAAAKYLFPFVIAAMSAWVGWLTNQVSENTSTLHTLEVHDAEKH